MLRSGLLSFVMLAFTSYPVWAGEPVPSGQPDARALAGLIDREINRQLEVRKVAASPPADDAEFLRRVYLDMHGVIPPSEKVVAFLDSKDPDKRAKLIDELLANPRYGQYQAEIWGTLLLGDNQTIGNKGPRFEALQDWLEGPFNNQPWNRIVHDLLTVTGPISENNAIRFYLNGQTNEPQRSLTDLTDSIASVFLGVQLKCAQCHDHFLTPVWKKSDYWGIASFFANVNLGGKQGISDDSKPGTRPEFLDDTARRKLTTPTFLQGVSAKLPSGVPGRRVFADWLTAAENPFFARATVNRMWAHFFGRGFVNPIDDLRADNPASHPELLDQLSKQFVASGFDLKYLVRAICNSQTYQRTSRPSGGNETDREWFSHMAVRVLSGGQLYDSLAVLLNKPRPSERDNRARAARKAVADYFEIDDDPTNYSRGIPQLLRLMNSTEFDRDRIALLQKITGAKKPSDENVEQLYLLVLARRPSPQERDRLVAFIQKPGRDPRKAYDQVFWVLLSTSEFSLNH